MAKDCRICYYNSQKDKEKIKFPFVCEKYNIEISEEVYKKEEGYSCSCFKECSCKGTL